MNWQQHLNIWFYIIGSSLFIIGSTFFQPYFSSTPSYLKIGVIAFIIGSICFLAASFQQLLTNFRSISSTNDAEPLVETSNEKIQDLAVSICRNTLSVVNGLLFTIGSVAFWPSYGHCGALVGNWFYRTGAVLGALISLWALVRLQIKSSLTENRLLRLLVFLSLIGSVCFFIGGIYFLIGKHDREGSSVWITGSIAFLISSVLTYLL